MKIQKCHPELSHKYLRFFVNNISIQKQIAQPVCYYNK